MARVMFWIGSKVGIELYPADDTSTFREYVHVMDVDKRTGECIRDIICKPEEELLQPPNLWVSIWK
jgi:hypothetical protein